MTTTREPLEYDAFFAHRTVTRLRSGDGSTAIEKVTEGPDLAAEYLYDNALREYAAYTSGLLDDLGPVRAPALVGAHEDASGRLTLVVEDIRHEGARPLDAGDLLRAAHDLGGLAARFLGNVPSHPWLFTDWITRHSQPGAWAEGAEVLTAAGSPALRLIDAQPLFRALLEQLPQTLCHHDAVGANVFRTASGIVLIDWESVGPGPVGADLASLLMSPRRGDASAHVVREVFDDAIAAYADGLGGRVPLADVRGGVDAAIGLRWKLARDVAATVASGEPARRGSAPHESPETALDELQTLTQLMLDETARLLG